MRVTLGIVIALPIAALFCLAYLILLALEACRDATHCHRSARSAAVHREEWTGPAGFAA